MNRIILVSTLLLSSHTIFAEPAKTDNQGFITPDAALHCIQLSKNVISSQQQLVSFQTRKANLKSKIDYLQNAIKIRRKKIEELDQRNVQTNNKNYNQLIDQFDNLSEERKQTIAQYETENQQHVSHNAEDINLQNTYTEQCLNNVKITKNLHQDICLSSSSEWCARFTF